MPRPEQFEKLPKWAQGHIRVLEQNLARERERLMAGPANSDTIAEPFAAAPKALGKRPLVRFELAGEHAYLDVRLDEDYKGHPFAYLMGSNSIAIEPQSSNTCRVRLVPRS